MLPAAPLKFYHRIAIIGCPGAGKSTLATKISAATNLPLHHLDALYWGPGWLKAPAAAWQMRHANVVAKPKWILDGNFPSTQTERLMHADCIIWLDYPWHLCLRRAIKRQINHHGKTRPDMGEAGPEKYDLKILGIIAAFPFMGRPDILRNLARIKHRTPIIHLQHPLDEAIYLDPLFH